MPRVATFTNTDISKKTPHLAPHHKGVVSIERRQRRQVRLDSEGRFFNGIKIKAGTLCAWCSPIRNNSRFHFQTSNEPPDANDQNNNKNNASASHDGGNTSASLQLTCVGFHPRKERLALLVGVLVAAVVGGVDGDEVGRGRRRRVVGRRRLLGRGGGRAGGGGGVVLHEMRRHLARGRRRLRREDVLLRAERGEAVLLARRVLVERDPIAVALLQVAVGRVEHGGDVPVSGQRAADVRRHLLIYCVKRARRNGGGGGAGRVAEADAAVDVIGMRMREVRRQCVMRVVVRVMREGGRALHEAAVLGRHVAGAGRRGGDDVGRLVRRVIGLIAVRQRLVERHVVGRRARLGADGGAEVVRQVTGLPVGARAEVSHGGERRPDGDHGTRSLARRLRRG